MYADAGYISSINVQCIVGKGGTPFIRPKVNSLAHPPPGKKDNPSRRSGEAYRNMVAAFKADETGWLRRYGARNTIESAWSGLKRRFGGTVVGATALTRRVEAALKLVVWNVTRMTRRG